jgi:DNA polymerase-3 subunit gamma/tau
MSYQVLARKWRPAQFKDVIGQDHVVKSLANSIFSKRIGQAYLFTGTRGVGKTTIARLFARAIRCDKNLVDGSACGVCLSCTDSIHESSMNIFEIDGASNNSVENIRDIISSITYPPSVGKYRIYIIDEVHMLSNNAFNALLKTLEEPPAHAVFIFATTEPQKLLGTVISRCQRFDLRPMALDILIDHVKKIALAEKFSFSSDSLISQLCRLGKGSARDTLSLLDLVLSFSGGQKIDEKNFAEALGIAKLSDLNNLVDAIEKGNSSLVSKIYHQMINENIDCQNILNGILEAYYDQIKKNISPEKIWIYETLAKDSAWIYQTIDPLYATEVLLLKVSLRGSYLKGKPTITSTITTETATTTSTIKTMATPATKAIVVPLLVSSGPIGPIRKDLTWDGFLDSLRMKSPAMTSNLEQGNLVGELLRDAGNLKIEIGFADSEKVFFDYLQDTSASTKLCPFLAEYFEVSPEKVNLKLTHVQQENFQSKAAIKEMARIDAEKIDENNILENPFVKQAQALFGAKVDKVILNKR